METSAEEDKSFKIDEGQTLWEVKVTVLEMEKTHLVESLEKYQNADDELKELREKESAYQETIREADSILGKAEGDYRQTVSGMEEELVFLRAKVEAAVKCEEAVAKEVKSLVAAKRENGVSASDANYKIAELLERLMEAEKRELSLRDQVSAVR
jgi:chromosome segregation ATPase